MGYLRIRPLGRDLSLVFLVSILSHMSSRAIIVNDLTVISFSDVFADKDHVASKLSLINVLALNYLLKSEIFVSEDGQLRAAQLILDYKPLSRIYQDMGQVLRVGNPYLARIDVSKPRFLTRRDLPPFALPVQLNPP